MGYGNWFGQAFGFKCRANKNLVNGEQDARDPWPAAATQLAELSVIAEVQTEASGLGAQVCSGNNADYNNCSKNRFPLRNTLCAY